MDESETLILTADTVVIAPTAGEQNDQEGKGVILGKPRDAEDARRMLKMLSGKTHHVVTGVSLTTQHKQRSFSVTTEVTFKPLSDDEISYYINHYQQQKTEKDASGKTSEKNGTYSVSYGSSQELATAAVQKQHQIVMKWLENTGLCYQGV